MADNENTGIDYIFPNPNVFGEECPICKKKSWNIFKCNKCGKKFCKFCRPDLVTEIDEDTLEVNCDCGETQLFIWEDKK